MEGGRVSVDVVLFYQKLEALGFLEGCRLFVMVDKCILSRESTVSRREYFDFCTAVSGSLGAVSRACLMLS